MTDHSHGRFEALHGVPLKAKTGLLRLCANCDEPIDRAAQITALYCSPTCRSAGLRDRRSKSRPDTHYGVLGRIGGTYLYGEPIVAFVLIGICAAHSREQARRKMTAKIGSWPHRPSTLTGDLVPVPLASLIPA